MARVVSASEANQRFSEILTEAAEGERVVITLRGKPVAQLTPYTASAEDAQREGQKSGALARMRKGLPLGNESFDRDSLYD